MSRAALFLRVAQQVFLNLAVALLLFFLPFEVLFRLSSWTLFMPGLDILAEVAMMTVVLGLVSAALALCAAGVGYVLVGLSRRSTTEEIAEALSAVAAIGSTILIGLFQLRAFKTLLQGATGHYLVLGRAKFVLLPIAAGGFALWVRTRDWRVVGRTLRSYLARGDRVVLIAIFAAVLFVGARGVGSHLGLGNASSPVSQDRAGMPNVILLSIDTLAAEDMSLYGYRLPTTPRMEAFAKTSYAFDRFLATSNWTTPTVASFLSGLYPVTSGVNHLHSYFLKKDRNKNLAHLLKDRGYRSAAIVGNPQADPTMLQIAESFSVTTEPLSLMGPVFGKLRGLMKNYYRTYDWLEEFVRGPESASSLGIDDDGYWQTRAVFDRALRVAETFTEPYFLWTHINAPHLPYLPAAPFKFRFGDFKAYSTAKDFASLPPADYPSTRQDEVDRLRLRYDEFILDTDAAVGDFLDGLKAMGRFDDSIIIITADHGESFTKNYFSHSGPHLHQPLIHVPLLVHLPGQTKGARVPFNSSQVDLLPTVMDVLGLPIPPWTDGESLKPAMLEGVATTQAKFAMGLYWDSRFARPVKGTLAVVQARWKLVRYLSSGKEELYDLTSDPAEASDLIRTNPEQARTMRALMDARFNLAK